MRCSLVCVLMGRPAQGFVGSVLPRCAREAKLNVHVGCTRRPLMVAETADWAHVKTLDIWRARRNGEVDRTEFLQAVTARLGSKVANLTQRFTTPGSNQAADVDGSDSAVAMEASWRQSGRLSAVQRSVEIWSFAIRMLLANRRANKLTDPAEAKKAKEDVALKLRVGLLKLGPTFIKLGQLLSTRIDVVDPIYIKELVLLQDSVPGFPGQRALEILEQEFGRPVEEIYESFEVTPVAAASLGQVHVATLLPDAVRTRVDGDASNGEASRKVAVKIQREGLEELFDRDLQNLKLLVWLLDKLDPKTDGADRNWGRIYEESSRLLYQEIDYVREAANALRFKTNFAGTPWVKVPAVYPELSTKRVLTMEYVPAIKSNDLAAIDSKGIDRSLLARRSAESYLTQLTRHGFFHCDPHPGNLACDEAYGGRLIYYDFGMMSEFEPNVRSGFVNLLFGIYENDAKGLCDALEEMGILRVGADRVSVERIARSFLADFAKALAPGGKWSNQLEKGERVKVAQARRKKIGADLVSVSQDVPFEFKPVFTFVFRAFTSLDGIGKGLDPTYDLTRLAQPYLNELLDLRDGSVALSALKGFAKKVGWRPQDIAAVVQSPRRVAEVADVTRKLEQGELKLRVRVLEAEQAFSRMELTQANMYAALAFSTFLNAALIVSVAAGPGYAGIARAFWAAAAITGVQVPIGWLKVKQLDKKLEKFGVR